MSAEIIQVAAEVAKNSSLINKIRAVATAHPAGAAVVATGVGCLAVFGGYKLMQKAFGSKESPVVVQVVQPDTKPHS